MKIKRFEQFNESTKTEFKAATNVKELCDKIDDNLTSGWLGSDDDLNESHEFIAVEDANSGQEGSVIYNGWSEDLTELTKDNEELQKIVDKMDSCQADLWEHDLENTVQGVLIEGVEYFDGDKDVKIEYNNWYEDLKKLCEK